VGPEKVFLHASLITDVTPSNHIVRVKRKVVAGDTGESSRIVHKFGSQVHSRLAARFGKVPLHMGPSKPANLPPPLARRMGFTLIELLVGIAIIALLASS
jgi:prepilin-type N-terminal cleavage/methylation domain-containing protein